MTILVASLIAPPFLDDQRRWGSWLKNHDEIVASVPGTDVKYYCAVELDGNGFKPYYTSGWQRLAEEVGLTYETFTYNSGRTTIEYASRLKHICMGRNMISQHATEDASVTHILGIDGDVSPPADILPKLLEVDYPIVSAHIPTYGFRSPRVHQNPRNSDQEYPNSWEIEATPLSSAGAWLVEREVFTHLRWRTDPILRFSDDPAYLNDARKLLNINPPVLQRSDTIAEHWPVVIGPIEYRLTDPKLEAL